MNIKQIKDFFPSIHKEGYMFIAIAVAFVLLSYSLLPSFLFNISWVVTLFIIYFFRDPDRVTPESDEGVISPADGVILKIEEGIEAPKELDLDEQQETYTRVSIFLNIFNVHVNRIPFSGKVTHLNYRPGKFFNASLDKASEYNERQSCVVTDKEGNSVIFAQVAGLIAKRIVCNLEPEQEVKAGDRYGIIRFGSRLDLYIPEGGIVLVKKGQTAIGGETIIANLDKSFKKKDIKKTATIKKESVKSKKPVIEGEIVEAKNKGKG